jgi:DNA-binding NtrC family response regulator
VLASTNSDLRQKVSEGSFRADLYYRLNVISIHIPPLRDRKEDLAPLCKHFLKKHAALNGNEEIKINGGILEHMHRYTWPGNIRELENTLKSFSVLRDEENFLAKLRNQYAIADSLSGLVPEETAPFASGYSGAPISRLPLKEVTKEAARKAETDTILDVLSYTRWNRRKTAALLKISYKALLNKIKEYEIEDRYRELVREQVAGAGPSTGSGPTGGRY